MAILISAFAKNMNAPLQIDHLLTKTDSPQDAGEWFSACGFTVTPLSVIGAMGLCNRLILFEPYGTGTANFIELMGTVPGGRTLSAMAALLAGDEGTRSMVLVSTDAHAARALLAQRGFAPGEVHHVTRQWELPGERLDLAFDVLLPMAAPLSFNVCRYHTLEHYLRPQWLRHRNGVQRLDAVLGVVDDAAAAAVFYERLFDVAVEHPGKGHARLRPGPVALELFDAAAYAVLSGRARPSGFAGYRLRCADPGESANWFERAGATVEHGVEGTTSFIRAFGNDLFLV